MKKIKIVYIYILFLFLICLGYFIDNPIKKIGFYEKANQYFGVTQLPIFLFLLFYGLIFFHKNKIKRFVLEVRLYFLLIVAFLAMATYIIYNSGLDLSNLKNLKAITLNEEYFRNLIENCLYKYKIGYVPTYILWLVLNIKYSFEKIFFGIIITQILLIFLIVFGPTKNYIKKSIKDYKFRKKLECEERLLQEQIKIKEDLEKKETIKKVKFRENKEKLLEEKVELFRKNTELKKFVNLNEQIGDKK